MTGSGEHIMTLTFVLLICTATFSLVQGQNRPCSLFSRPHPKGLCGHKLALAHENLCFLIRQKYTLYFPMTKRSDAVEASDLDNAALSHFKDVDDADAGLGSGQEYVHDISSLTNTNNDLPLLSAAESGNISDGITASTFLNVLAKRGSRPHRSLVCDCCYRQCSPATLALYC